MKVTSVAYNRFSISLFRQPELIFVRSKVNIDERALVWVGLVNVHGVPDKPFMWLSGDGALFKNFGDTFDSSYSEDAQLVKHFLGFYSGLAFDFHGLVFK